MHLVFSDTPPSVGGLRKRKPSSALISGSIQRRLIGGYSRVELKVVASTPAHCSILRRCRSAGMGGRGARFGFLNVHKVTAPDRT